MQGYHVNKSRNILSSCQPRPQDRETTISHFRPLAPNCVRTFLLSALESVSLSSGTGALSFFFLLAVFFSAVAEVGVGASDGPLSLLLKVVEMGVGAPGVDVPDAGVAASCYKNATVVSKACRLSRGDDIHTFRALYETELLEKTRFCSALPTLRRWAAAPVRPLV